MVLLTILKVPDPQLLRVHWCSEPHIGFWWVSQRFCPWYLRWVFSILSVIFRLGLQHFGFKSQIPSGKVTFSIRLHRDITGSKKINVLILPPLIEKKTLAFRKLTKNLRYFWYHCDWPHPTRKRGKLLFWIIYLVSNSFKFELHLLVILYATL